MKKSSEVKKVLSSTIIALVLLFSTNSTPAADAVSIPDANPVIVDKDGNIISPTLLRGNGAGLTNLLSNANTANDILSLIERNSSRIAQYATWPNLLTNVLVPTNFLKNLSVDFTNAINSVIVLHTNGTTTVFKATENTDVARGQALMNAIWMYGGIGVAPTNDGDVLYLSPGGFDIGNIYSNMWFVAMLDLSYESEVNGASIVGAGKDKTMIYAAEPPLGLFSLGNASSFRDLTISNGSSGLAITDGFMLSKLETNRFNIFINVRIISPLDVFLVLYTPLNFHLHNSEFYGCYDIFANAAGIDRSNSVTVISDCFFYVDANGGIGGRPEQDYARIGFGRMSRAVYVYNSTVIVTNGLLGTWGVYGDGYGNTTFLHNVSITANGHTNVWDIYNWRGDTLFVDSDCIFNSAKITNKGTIKYNWVSIPN